MEKKNLSDNRMFSFSDIPIFRNKKRDALQCVSTISTFNFQQKNIASSLSERRNEKFVYGIFYFKKLSRIPAATAEPTTPETLGPIACCSR